MPTSKKQCSFKKDGKKWSKTHKVCYKPCNRIAQGLPPRKGSKSPPSSPGGKSASSSSGAVKGSYTNPIKVTKLSNLNSVKNYDWYTSDALMARGEKPRRKMPKKSK